MSYKMNLSDLKRDGDVSLTQQLVDRFVAAIESGELPPGPSPVAELGGTPPEVFAREGGAALPWLPAEGLYPLREQIAKRGRRHGFATDAEEVVVTSGAQQALRLTGMAALE